MTDHEIDYFRTLVGMDMIRAPVLEVGADYGGKTLRESVQALNYDYYTTDMRAVEGVDFVADLEKPDASSAFHGMTFGTCLVMNILEHVFSPAQVLDNILALLKPGGTMVVVTPVIWPVHNYPIDCQRLLPDWYIQYGRRRDVKLEESTFMYLGVGSVLDYRGAAGYELPPPSRTPTHRMYSEIVHRMLRTNARGIWCNPHVLLGVVFRKPGG